MSRRDQNGLVRALPAVFALVLAARVLPAQMGPGAATATAGSSGPGSGQGSGLGSGSGQGVVLDRIVAVVNSDVVLESDIDEERRFSAFQPPASGTSSEGFSRERAVERLINRDLILEQAKLQPQPPITDKEVDAQLEQLRKDSPKCRAYHCETDAGWAKFVADQGFTMDELRARWRQRMEALRFIEIRFRSGIQISNAEIQEYYDKTLLPEYAKQKVPPAKLADVSDRIREVLLQQQVSNLLGDWLKSLRVQGSVRVIQPDGAVAQ